MPLEDKLNLGLAEDYGVRPEQVTLDLIHELRKKSYDDGLFDFLAVLKRAEIPMTQEGRKRIVFLETCCQNKIRKWAQEYLQHGPTPCTR